MKKKLKDYTSFKFAAYDVFREARLRCMKEMYAKAQPSVNYDDILAYYKDCKEKGIEPERIYDRYYLSYEEYKYILNKYIEAYHFKEQFKSNCDVIINDMKNGCPKDKYINDRITKDGEVKPGYRSTEKVPPLAKIIGGKDAKRVIKFIEERKNFYMFDRAESDFSITISMGDSPCSNPQTVIDYWKTQGVDLKIDPRHYDYDDFWSEENGYIYDDDPEIEEGEKE